MSAPHQRNGSHICYFWASNVVDWYKCVAGSLFCTWQIGKYGRLFCQPSVLCWICASHISLMVPVWQSFRNEVDIQVVGKIPQCPGRNAAVCRLLGPTPALGSMRCISNCGRISTARTEALVRSVGAANKVVTRPINTPKGRRPLPDSHWLYDYQQAVLLTIRVRFCRCELARLSTTFYMGSA